jgi:hypothetical protein
MKLIAKVLIFVLTFNSLPAYASDRASRLKLARGAPTETHIPPIEFGRPNVFTAPHGYVDIKLPPLPTEVVVEDPPAGWTMAGVTAPDFDQSGRLRRPIPPATPSGGGEEPPTELDSLPLLTWPDDFTIDGGWCTHDGSAANPYDGLYVGFQPAWSFAYDSTDNTIYTTSDPTSLSGRGLVHLTIPTTLVNSGTVSSLPVGTYAASTPIIEATEGRYVDSTIGVYPGDPTTSGLTGPTATFIYGSRICGAYQYYYGEGDPPRPFYCRPKNFFTTGQVEGMTHLNIVGTDATARMFVATCGHVPTQWQTALGGPNFCAAGATFSIINTQSRGPSLGILDPEDIIDGSGNITGLVYYPGTHQTLGGWDLGDWADGNPATNSEMMDITTSITGAAIIKDSRTTIFVGTAGNSACYGTAKWDPNDPLIGTPTGDGEDVWCWDPTNPYKANHGFPYDYRVWLVDTLQMAKVKAGTTNPATGQPWKPWDIVPYQFVTFEFPVIPQTLSVAGELTHQKRIRGVGYNETTQKLIIMQDRICAGSNGAGWRYSINTTP